MDTTTEGRRSFLSRRWLLLVSIAGALVAGVWLYSATGSGEAAAAYVSQPVARGDLVVQVSATAVLRPRTQIEIASALKGIVQSVPVLQNQRIRRGDILARLDSTVFQYAVNRSAALVQVAEASLSDAEINLKESEQKLARARALRQNNAISQQRLEDAQAEHERARNRVATARADLGVKKVELKLKRFDLGRTTIRSPINGVVLERNAEPGRTVFASSDDGVLFILAEDLERMELIAKISEADIGTVARGQEASFTVDAYPERTFKAEIRDVSFAHSEENGLVTYEARLDVHNADLRLRPGMTASLTVNTHRTEGALLIPVSALRYRPQEPDGSITAPDASGSADKPMVHVLENGLPVPVPVELGVRNWEKAEVLSGLSEGQAVITGEAWAGALP
ncbi:efflux RND transporter periplasmic adaptor subunit [Nitratireductor sp. GISD-1A_MAKvit]|uniref:efflux RND transporter periplasmic adaptor subunit n=1 Tax=Nitratireductor sp. GISD-1A_MAKvit TaxID=3234198 RepID=UPI0034661D2F